MFWKNTFDPIFGRRWSYSWLGMCWWNCCFRRCNVYPTKNNPEWTIKVCSCSMTGTGWCSRMESTVLQHRLLLILLRNSNNFHPYCYLPMQRRACLPWGSSSCAWECTWARAFFRVSLTFKPSWAHLYLPRLSSFRKIYFINTLLSSSSFISFLWYLWISSPQSLWQEALLVERRPSHNF